MEIKDQISIITNIFLVLAGVAATVLGFILTVYTLKLGNKKSINNPKLKYDKNLLVSILGISIGQFIICMIIVLVSSVPDNYNPNKLYTLSSPEPFILCILIAVCFQLILFLLTLLTLVTKTKNTQISKRYSMVNLIVSIVPMLFTVLTCIFNGGFVETNLLSLMYLMIVNSIHPLFHSWVIAGNQ